MGILKHVVTDHYAHKENWLTNIDVRVKLFYMGTGIILNICSNNVIIPSIFLATSLALLMTINIPIITIGLRMLMPLLFGVFIVIIMGLHKGETVVFSGSLFGYELVLRKEGLLSGLLIFSKVAGGVMLLLLLSFTTSITKICVAAQWMRIPNTLVEVLSFVYRYLFLLLEEAETMMSSQRSRLGHTTWSKTIKSLGTLGGMLIIRSIIRAESVHTAMISRGYDGGRILSVKLAPLERNDYVILLSSGVVLISLFYLSFFISN
ncbi:MAG: cobalt ECF transporter T component CbiQ [Candidatus Scalinduaceae bacterium]